MFPRRLLHSSRIALISLPLLVLVLRSPALSALSVDTSLLSGEADAGELVLVLLRLGLLLAALASLLARDVFLGDTLPVCF